jgi:hypothetical protein
VHRFSSASNVSKERLTGPRNGGGLRALGCACLCAAVVALAPAPALAGDTLDMAKEAGLGAGSAVTSLVYAPLKLLYATGGLLVGGLAWTFSGGDADVAKVVLTPSVRGDYVITPDTLTGRKPLEFFGREPGYQSDWGDVASKSDDWTEPEPAPVDEGW